MRDVVILGSTGSIGVQALEVIASNPQQFRVVAISSAGSNPELVIAQAKQFKVSHVGVVRSFRPAWFQMCFLVAILAQF